MEAINTVLNAAFWCGGGVIVVLAAWLVVSSFIEVR